MDLCLLCLEIKEDLADTISINSKQWQDLNMAEIIEKHIWPVNITDSDSLICLLCWKEVQHFHKFYKRLEEAHVNFGKITFNAVGEEKAVEQQTPATNPVVETEAPSTNLLYEIFIDDMPVERLKVKNDSVVNEFYDKRRENEKLIKQHFGQMFCDICKQPFIDFSCLRKHFLRVHNQRGYLLCCKRKYYDRSPLVDHILHHINPYHFQCSKCQKRFTSRVYLIRHMRVAHMEKDYDNDRLIAEHFKQILCDICQAPAEDYTDMLRHFNNKHKKRGYMICCRKKFFGRPRLIDHIKWHLNPTNLKCTICGKIMSNVSSFDYHIERIHGGVQNVNTVNETNNLTEVEVATNDNTNSHNSNTKDNESFVVDSHMDNLNYQNSMVEEEMEFILDDTNQNNQDSDMNVATNDNDDNQVIGIDNCNLFNTVGTTLHVRQNDEFATKYFKQILCALCQEPFKNLYILRRHYTNVHKHEAISLATKKIFLLPDN